ncbi:TetR/AcrR family transcriptional regulator [Lentzea tibetensis]|uniref:TetR/AcrR family transcriptional regulator n=1 Tax=Lentzea tibetensis TaxID=2591470 RepID=A0A563EJ98_9PSEU|nr:TetR/AcrR family transcriptional regulator [Lentzea tibetensis]TWP46108.1 TetR/AcrR family transcriptional regulator [Lentzea tibetensis]
MTELPPEITLLWGVRETPRRGRKPSLTAADITRAAIAVADAEGLAAVSMARVAAELGNATMALYRHVKSKDELLALMTDGALDPPPVLPGGDWRIGLTTWSEAIMASFQKHPWYAQVTISGPPIGPNNLAWFDRGLSALEDTPLEEGEKVGIVMGLITYLHGELRLSFELAEGYRENPEAFSRVYAAALRRFVDPREMPALAKVVDAGVFDYDTLYDEQDLGADFNFGLNLYLDGIAAYLDRRSST